MTLNVQVSIVVKGVVYYLSVDKAQIRVLGVVADASKGVKGIYVIALQVYAAAVDFLLA